VRRRVPAERVSGLAARAGLAAPLAEARRARYGANDVVERVERPWRALASDTARDPMLWFLAVTAALYAVLGQRAEALTLLAAVAPLAGMDAFLHRRTQAATTGLRSLLATTALVVRDGAEIRVPAAAVVPGDLALVGAGEAFPADGVLVDAQDVQADESSLTGEAYPVAKAAFTPDLAGAVVDERHWAFAGTRALTGRGRLRVVFTGAETLYGEIVRSASTGGRARTPLQAEVGRLVTTLVWAAAALCLALAAARYAQGHGLLDALVSAATLAVAALPEELPVALTFFLGLGVFRLARRHALVRRAVCVENIGRITCICADKTGTITEGRLRVAQWAPADGVPEAVLVEVAAAASRRESGDPLDAAILDAAGGAARAQARATFPYTEARRRETAVVRRPDGATVAMTKGSPEVILRLAGASAEEAARWTTRVGRLAEGARKVIACAQRPIGPDWDGGEPEDGYVMAGLLALTDPIRAGVPEAVRRCREGGIHPIVVTGDHPETARAVASAIGLGEGRPRLLLGDELAGRLAGGLDPREVDVIARAVPTQKLDLVRALQTRGEIVAVTGDGVNDVPALKAADVGIAMGERGTPSAREAAPIVLLDDDFGTIVSAIAEGRQLFHNLKLSFRYLLTAHMWLLFPATLVPLAGFPLLFLPIHIVWLELIVHPTALLAFQDLPARRALDGPPPARRVRFFSRAEWAAMWAAGLLGTAAILLGYARGLGSGGPEQARSAALAWFCLGSAFLAGALGGLKTATARAVCAATVVASLALLQVPPLATRLHARPLGLLDWALAVLGAAAACGLPFLAARAIRRGRRAWSMGTMAAGAANTDVGEAAHPPGGVRGRRPPGRR
jgi:Ca2+-transporting ATPase